MRLHLLTLLAALSPYAFADVEFVTPVAGGSPAAGTLAVTWKDSGTAPLLSALTTYTLQLIVGGNDATTQTALTSTTGTVSTDSASLAVAATLAGSTTNGFFLKMISVASEGGTIINYSSRFTITGMTGTTPATAITAVTALDGATAGPATENDVTTDAGTTAAAAGGEFTVPYNLQTGLTKYAPMQPVPPTKITQKNYTPLYPTSSYSIATTYLPQASIATTMTESQTFSVVSIENTVCTFSLHLSRD